MIDANTDDRTCIICGKPLPKRRKYYCSDECRDARWHQHLEHQLEVARNAVGYRPMMWGWIAAEQIRLHPVCNRCGRTDELEAHHIRALKSGGSNEFSNLITLCHGCHRAQHKGSPRRNDPSLTIQKALI